jgi:hypothetical protein
MNKASDWKTINDSSCLSFGFCINNHPTTAAILIYGIGNNFLRLHLSVNVFAVAGDLFPETCFQQGWKMKCAEILLHNGELCILNNRSNKKVYLLMESYLNTICRLASKRIKIKIRMVNVTMEEPP